MILKTLTYAGVGLLVHYATWKGNRVVSLLGAAGIGLFVGAVVGALGAGGGIIAVPVLTYLLGQSEHAATNGSLVIVALTAAVALPGKARRGQVRWRDGLVFGAMTLLGAVPGRFINELLDPETLFLAFSALLLTVSAVMIIRSIRDLPGEGSADPDPQSRGGATKTAVRSLIPVAGAAGVTGLLTGLFGVGGGFAVVPVFVVFMGFGVRQATGTSLLVMIIAAGVSILTGVVRGTFVLDWGLVLLFASGSMVGGVLAGPLSQRVPPAMLSAAFGVLIGVVGIITVVRTVAGV
ncbi:sulfite exporter TauE/SafE family protein [Corynebacterium sp. P5848]|uniref:sulfite exporter TauE/SafE family protein n=1 Tax=Corynebacterium marambiense TaxID=2765364 RepID=UPI002260DAB8|nr:sulfite exporter TauE/SafE family protein [Corynebacterium marambiense]MCX7541569.1 sulfite exporter TauE/SafE family protein [Corynebacterium marambiense]